MAQRVTCILRFFPIVSQDDGLNDYLGLNACVTLLNKIGWLA